VGAGDEKHGDIAAASKSAGNLKPVAAVVEADVEQDDVGPERGHHLLG
jgi:hypothetical protein